MVSLLFVVVIIFYVTVVKVEIMSGIKWWRVSFISHSVSSFYTVYMDKKIEGRFQAGMFLIG